MDSIIKYVASELKQAKCIEKTIKSDRDGLRYNDIDNRLDILLDRLSDKTILADLQGELATLRFHDKWVYDCVPTYIIDRLEHKIKALQGSVRCAMRLARGYNTDRDDYLLRPIGSHTVLHGVGVDKSKVYPKNLDDIKSVKESVGGCRCFDVEDPRVVFLEFMERIDSLFGTGVSNEVKGKQKKIKTAKVNKRKHMSASHRRRSQRRLNKSLCRQSAADLRLSKLI